MNCDDIKKRLDLNLTIQGMQSSTEIEMHIQGCPACREQYEQLVATGHQLSELDDIAMTPIESERLLKSLNGIVIRRQVTGMKSRLIGWSKIALRPALAGILVMIISLTHGFMVPPMVISENGFDEFQLSRMSEADLILLVVDGEGDILPSILDQQASSYITGQISSDQAADILDEISAEEIEWLFENFTVEI